MKTDDETRLMKALDFVTAEVEVGSFPGAGLAVSLHGRTLLKRYWGTYCNGRERETPFDASVLNMCFSFSKGVSATVVVMTHQDGLIDYDAPVSEYIPEFVGGGKEAITVRHLLTHSAGIPSVALGSVLTQEQWQAAVDEMCKSEVEWPPGSKTQYHGITGMFVAAEVVRRVSGMRPWEAICRERLFEPLGAQGFTFALPPSDVPLAFTPQPHELPFTLSPESVIYLGHPAGGCFGRLDDMLRLLNLHLNRGLWNGARLIEESAWEEMHRIQYADQIAAARAAGESPVHEPWGLGWLLRGERTGGWFGFGSKVSSQTFGHAGINTVMTVADPKAGFALAFLTTDSPKSGEETVRVRNTLTDLVAEALI